MQEENQLFDKIRHLHFAAIKIWGKDSRKRKAVEELIELCDALNQDIKKGCLDDLVLEEMADVVIVLNGLMLAYNISPDQLEEEVSLKAEKFRKIIDHETISYR